MDLCFYLSGRFQVFLDIFYVTLVDYRWKYVLRSSSLLNASQAVPFLKISLNWGRSIFLYKMMGV